MTASMTWVRGLRSTFELPIFEETHNRALARMGLRVVHHSKIRPVMSALGQKRTFRLVPPMSALPPKADIGTQSRDLRFVPKADILRCSEERRYSTTSSA